MPKHMALLAALAYLLAGCTVGNAPANAAGGVPPPTPTASAASCQGPARREIAPYFAAAVGGSPAWVIGDVGDTPSYVTGPPGALVAPQKKVLWAIEPGHDAPVTLRGQNLADGSPLWFEPGSDAPTTTLILDPRKPGIPVQHGQWREWPSYLYVPTPGCYALEASWPGGGWRITFAAR